MEHVDVTTAESRDAAPEERAYAKVFRRLVPFLMLCYGVAYLDRVNLGFAKLQMAGELKLDDTVYGLGAGIFFIGYFLFEVPSNLLLRRVGARRWIARIMITWGLVSGLCAFIRTPAMFYTLRFLLGVAEAGFYPGIILYLTYWYPAARFGRATAAFMVAVPLSGVLGNPLSGWIMDGAHGLAGLHGWQWMFLLEALPSIAMGVAVLFYLNDGIHDAHWLTDDEKRVLERNISRNEAEKQGPRSVLAAFADGRLWLCCLIYFSVVAGLYGLGFWLPTLVSATGVQGNFLIGCLSAIPNVVAIVAMMLLGRSADARRERRWHFVVPALAGAVGLVGAALMAHNAVIAIAFLSLAAAGVISCLPLFWSLPTAFLRGVGAAAGIAGINSVGNLAGFVAPSMIGFLRDTTHDNRIGMYALAGIVVVGALAVLRMRPEVVNR
ncbi:MAG TPA: MFS transporter [Opitutus sp.]|nr:MFS transporter [Opitutus sp.]